MGNRVAVEDVEKGEEIVDKYKVLMEDIKEVERRKKEEAETWKVVVALVLFIPIVLFNAFTFMVLWNWFVVALGVVALSFPHALGLSLMAFAASEYNPKASFEHVYPGIVYIALRNTLALGIGYVIYLMMG